MIGSAAAAMRGALAATIDVDFLIRGGSSDRKKLSAIAADLAAELDRPFFPVSKVMRLLDHDEALQAYFVSADRRSLSFAEVWQRSESMPVGSVGVRVAALADIERIEAMAGWRRDRALIVHDMIRRRVAAPIERRTNFLRRRVGICSTAL
jgi:hypothetical protein